MKTILKNLIFAFFLITFSVTFNCAKHNMPLSAYESKLLSDTLNKTQFGKCYIYKDIYNKTLDEFYDTVRIGNWKIIENGDKGIYSIGKYHEFVIIKRINDFWEIENKNDNIIFSWGSNDIKNYPKIGKWSYYNSKNELLFNKYYYNDICLFHDDINNEFWNEPVNFPLCYLKKQRNMKLYQYDWYFTPYNAKKSDLTKENLYAQVILDTINYDTTYNVKKIYIFEKGSKIDSLVFDN